MKKCSFRIFGILMVVMLLLQAFVFAYDDGSENGMFKVIDLGDVQIAYTNRLGMGLHDSYMYRGCGVFDKDGKVIVEPIYDEILPPEEGRAAFRLDGKLGFFDENWNVVIEAKYFTNIFPFNVHFSEGLAAVGKGSYSEKVLWGYIDRDGNEVIDFKYHSAGPFENGSAKVGISEGVYNYNTKMKYGKIDKEGNIVEPLKFSYFYGEDHLWKNERLDVLMSVNLVDINGRRYKNSDIKYPFINYLGISYIPLTYYGCRMMGINCDWTAEEGVKLSNGGEIAEDIVGKNGMKNGAYEKAEIYKGSLTVNGKKYEYGDTAYPLISFRDVVYMPVLWQTGMESLGIEYSYLRADQLENSVDGCMVFKVK